MSPTKRPSAVTSLRRAVGDVPAAAAPASVPSPAAAPAVKQEKPAAPARVTLNLPPELYRELSKWSDFAADQIGVTRVSIQDALRAMVRAGIHDDAATAAAIEQLQHERED